MTITQLKYVLAVAEHKNFTTASEFCFVTQPTLSMQIHKLEEELGIQIFNRGKKPIELTDVGVKIVNQAKTIVNESNRITDIVEQEKGYIGGQFKLGIIPTIMPSLLPLFLKNFNRKYPEVELIINELTTESIMQKLNDGHLDAAIAATPLLHDTADIFGRSRMNPERSTFFPWVRRAADASKRTRSEGSSLASLRRAASSASPMVGGRSSRDP